MRALPFVISLVVFLSGCERTGIAEAAPNIPAKPARALAFAGDALPPLESQGEAQPGGTLRVALETEPPSLNYQLDPLDLWAKKIDDLLFETLARPNPRTYVHEPRLAESWTISPDKLTLTFALRKDVQWSDKTPFTADDVLFTFDVLRNPTSKTLAVKSYLTSLDKVEKLDDHTVRFTLKEPYWYAFDVIAEMMIYPKHIFSRGDFNTHPANKKPTVGNGPYKLVRWAHGDEIVLEKNPTYFGKPGHVDKIVFKYVPDANVRLMMAKRGDLDVVERISSLEAWRKLGDDTELASRYLRVRHVPTGLQWLGWNTARPALSDKRVRRALTMLIDRQDIVDNLRMGLDRIATSWFYPGAKEYNETLLPLPYDAHAAVRLLGDAGYKDTNGDGIRDKNGVPLSITFLYPANIAFYEQLSGLLVEDMKRVGVQVLPVKLEWTAFMERVSRGDFDACSLLWQLAPRSDPFAIWHSSSIGGSNYIQYKNPALDKLLEDARKEYDEDKRAALYKRFSEILADEQPYTLLFNRYNLSLISKKLGGVYSTPYGIVRYDDLYFTKAK